MGAVVKLERIDWRGEISWAVISLISGIVLSALFVVFDRFPAAGEFSLVATTCICFYLFSILLRIHNHRGRRQSNKPGLSELDLKVGFPILGFAAGLCIIFL